MGVVTEAEPNQRHPTRNGSADASLYQCIEGDLGAPLNVQIVWVWERHLAAPTIPRVPSVHMVYGESRDDGDNKDHTDRHPNRGAAARPGDGRSLAVQEPWDLGACAGGRGLLCALVVCKMRREVIVHVEVAHSRLPVDGASSLFHTKPELVPVLCVDTCLLYTSDAADEEDSVDLGGRRIIKKKKKQKNDMYRRALL
eukprot:TRINITY_DN1649_c0_g2_i2.p3 TRINITY_DN1649_c0_g2~~TRINITY_DN1649_c0_g2_i2.p3  ORF type:complete len:198 (-),score=26.64 TRINITY_DN1649_c0_g2_i2:80-673(-)